MNVIESTLSTILSRTWWVLMLRGIIAILFGLITWKQPELSIALLIIFFGAYILADGILGVFAAVAGRKHDDGWWIMLLWAFVGVGVGLLVLVKPGVAALALLIYIAIWAIATGVFQIAIGVRLRKEIKGEWFLIIGGLISVVFGAFLVSQPAEGALALAWLIATYAILFGILLVILALRMRSFGKKLAR